MRLTALVITAFALSGCCINEGPEAVAVSVIVVDANSGTSLAAGTTLRVTSRGCTEQYTAAQGADGPLSACSSPGTYIVEVSRPGYQPWRRDAVRVNETGTICKGIDGVELTAALHAL